MLTATGRASGDVFSYSHFFALCTLFRFMSFASFELMLSFSSFPVVIYVLNLLFSLLLYCFVIVQPCHVL